MRKTTSENMHILICVQNIILAERCIFSIILLCCAASTWLMKAADKWSVLNTATAFPPIHPVSQYTPSMLKSGTVVHIQNIIRHTHILSQFTLSQCAQWITHGKYTPSMIPGIKQHDIMHLFYNLILVNNRLIQD